MSDELFESLYEAAVRGEREVPWDREEPRPRLVEWARGLDGKGQSALVVGAGFGTDAEFVSGLGFDTTAFDVAPTAIRLARERHPGTRVNYTVADLLDPPEAWRQRFDLVVECLTAQSIPDGPRPRAIANIAAMAAPGGTLLVIASGRDEEDGPVQGPPWPLTRAEVESFATGGLETVAIEAFPQHPRWRAEFRRPPLP